jgi:hypothetical protein
MHVPLTQHEQELLLGELRVDIGQRHAMECEIPGRVPRVFPFVGHRDHVGVVQVRPLAVPALTTVGGRRRLPGISVEPLPDFVVVELLRPEQAGERLARDVVRVGRKRVRQHAGVELICLPPARVEHAREVSTQRRGLRGLGVETEPQRGACARVE